MSTYKPKDELLTDWIAALRSGNYQQGQWSLSQAYSDGKVTYCCLGVLCELVGLDKSAEPWGGGADKDGNTPVTQYRYRGQSATTLPFDLEEHIEIDTGQLIGMNDDMNCTFAQIADAIEAMLATSETSPEIYKCIDE